MLNNNDNNHLLYIENEIDNIYMNLLVVIGENSDKIDLRELKNSICEKYKFFNKIPVTIVFIGAGKSGKSSVLSNTLNSLRDKQFKEMNFSSLNLKNRLIIYENSEDEYFNVVRKKNKEIIINDDCLDEEKLNKLFEELNLNNGDYEYDEIIVKIPHINVAFQILDTPYLNEYTISIIESCLAQTSIPVFVLVNSINLETKFNEKYFDLLKNLFNKFHDSYYYLVLTKVDLLENKIKSENEKEKNIDLFSSYIKSFLNNLDKINFKFIGLTIFNNQSKNKEIYKNFMNFLIKFNYDNLAVLRFDYFKCLIKSTINGFSLSSSKKNNFSTSEIDDFKKKTDICTLEFEYKLNNFFEKIPILKKDIKILYPYWYNTLKKEMIQNDKKVLKNQYFNKSHFMTDHIELIKITFEGLFQDHVKKLILEVVPVITFSNKNIELCLDDLNKVITNYSIRNLVGIWTKKGAYSDIIVKLFKRVKENKSSVFEKCKKLFESSFKLKFSQIDNVNRTFELTKTFLNIIDRQLLNKREISIFGGKQLLNEHFNSNIDDAFLDQFKLIIKNI